MKIQVTRDENINYDIALSMFVDAHVNDTLERFAKRITEVDVHFSLVSGETSGGDERRCHMTAVGEGIETITANDDAPTFEAATRRATDRMLLLLTSKFGPLGDRAIASHA